MTLELVVPTALVEDICKLPPLKSPLYRTQRAESSFGIVYVVLTCTFFISLTNLIVRIDGFDDDVAWTFLILIYTEAVVAIICLFGLLFKNPGIIKRSPEICFPLPKEVADTLAAGGSIEGLSNITEGNRSYCVRCCVWRTMKETAVSPSSTALPTRVLRQLAPPHHCSICQRCVMNFDHHCSVFGRCIAGNGLQGNIVYFYALIAMGGLGVTTWLACVIVGCYHLYESSASNTIGTVMLVLACLLGSWCLFVTCVRFCALAFARWT